MAAPDTPDTQNCVRTSEKYWMTSLVDPVSHFTILPKDSMSLGAKLNSVLRLTIIISLILIATRNRFLGVFLLLAFSANVLAWFIYRNDYTES